MAVLVPYIPEIEVEESIQWRTDVLRCKSAEQRISLRNIPRLVVETNHWLDPAQAEILTLLVRNNMASDVYVPLWQDGARIGAITTGASLIPVVTENSRYTAGNYVLVMEEDRSNYEIIEISVVQANQLDLLTNVSTTYVDAYICPVYIGNFNEGISLTKYAGDYLRASVSYILDQNTGVVGAQSFPAYKTSYVMADRPLLRGSVREDQQREVSRFDNLAGPIHYETDYTYAVGRTSQSWYFDTRAELKAFRDWLYFIKGRQGSFYQPRWVRDFILTVDIADTDPAITVDYVDGVANTYEGPICIILNDGTQYYRDISAWTAPAGGNQTVGLDSPLGVNITIAEVEMITRMPKMRLNSDSIATRYDPGGGASVRAALMEIPE